MAGQPNPSSLHEFTRRAVIAVALLALAAIVWYTAEIFLLAFGGILLAVFLDFLAGRLAAVTPLHRGWSFVVVAVCIAALLGLAGWEAAPRVSDQINQLIHQVPKDIESARTFLQGREWGRVLLDRTPAMLASANIAGKLVALLKSVFDGLAGIVVIVVVGLYLGADPTLYERGLLKLFAEQDRGRARDVLNEVAYTLRWWVLGQLIPMALLGVATGVGLWLLHVNLAFTLALFTAFMIFIPYIGSIIALVVTVLVTLPQGTTLVLYVALLFVAVHIAEGYLVTPLVQRRAVYLAPGLTILSQVLMGLLLGFLGLALATPLTAATLVLVKLLYVGERPEHHV